MIDFGALYLMLISVLPSEVALCIQMRGRSYSYSPSPPRGGYGRRVRSPSPRGRYAARSRDLPTSLLVRNLRRDCRPEDLRRPFGQFGPLKDIYLPRDYYSGDPRGFGFVQYIDPADAAEAKYQMDGQILHGRELTVVFAEENRKKPSDMRARERVRGRSYDRRRSPARHSHSPRYSRSPRQERYRSRSPGYYPCSPRPGRYSRSYSPDERRYRRESSYSRSPHERGPVGRSRSRTPENYARAHRERSLSSSQ
ncbi:serine/arginine-rich SC35-like splicing factor SCL33 isoform X1 [Papaver somniferum]|uniref:serine/arginine-rich SC35-like splicing factor SCL33 isoform X1 n=2 Tax=Papaver somniferum TaxID=3469 RepID=UPI000E703145|nr:serine/arginine-rich SC35-like splicing factor SCL33 isoform X1 [Papaver somniferum]